MRLTRLGNALQLDRRFSEVADAYCQAIEHRPGGKHDAMLYERCAANLRNAGRLEEAMDCLTEAIALEMNADREKAFHLRAECYWDQKHYGKAARDWEQALKLAPFTSPFAPRLFECYLWEQDYFRATTFLDGRTGESEFDRLIIAKNSAAMERIDTAEQSQLFAAWDRFIERVVVHLPPGDDLEQLVAVHRYADDVKSKSQPGGAIEPGPWMIVAHDEEFFSELIRLMPRDYRPWEARARAFAVDGDWDWAAADYAETLRLINDTQHSVWWGTDATVAMQIAQLPEVFRRVRALRPDDDRLSVACVREYTANEQFQCAVDEL